MRKLGVAVCWLVLAASAVDGRQTLSLDKRAQIVRELMAEYGTAKVIIPRSKKPLAINPKGTYDEDVWQDAMDKFGPAAKLGNLVQITNMKFERQRLILQLNHGIKGGRKWWHRIQISGGASPRQRGTPIGGQNVYAPGGTTISLVFAEAFPDVGPDEIKKMLKPVLDFEQRSATQLYVESLPEEFQEAIKENTVLPGMDRDMVLLARGRPNRKVREAQHGVESEDWTYGTPPGNITFVTFVDGKVTRVRDSYAGVGGEVRTDEPVEQ